MIVILILVLLLTIVYYLLKPLFYWRERGVKQCGFPKVIFENYFKLFKKMPSVEFINNYYRMFPGTRYHGQYLFNEPSLMITDLDLLKQMVIKDFEYFNEHLHLADEESDPMWANNLFSLKGKRWKHMRTTLSPVFTSSKMRGIFILMQKSADSLVTYFQNQNNDLIEIEAKDVFSKYCNDVIASTVFGCEVDSLLDPTNDFFLNGKKLLNFSNFATKLKLIIGLICPAMAKMLKLNFIDSDARNFFTHITETSIKMREEKRLVRHDMIHLLLEARKGNLSAEDNNASDTGFASTTEHLKAEGNIDITNDVIIAQALLFFFAGFDSSSTLMSFMAYELCVNSDIQDNLRREIEEVFGNCNNELTYEALVNMKYMDMVVTESLRKWPVQASMDRICSKPYVIEPTLPGEKPVRIEAGKPISIPISGFHHDPKYFPNPEVFDPERFSEENKGKMKQYSFQPFGLGPRNCIGSRFALLKTKVLFFYILKNFKIVPIEKTDIPIKLSKSVLLTTSDGGFHMGLKCI